MSSYGSSHSGYLRPSQYPPNPPQQQPPQPPYPTTPGAPPTSQSQTFHPPASQHQHPMYSTSPQQRFYSTSPTSQYQTPLYSTSPTAQVAMPQSPMDHHRRSSSLSQGQRPQFLNQSAPIPIAMSQRPIVYARNRNGSHGSQHSVHMHDAHAYADGEDKYAEEQQRYGELDEETLRSYERRYAKDRKLEKRPTLGDSLMSMARALGGKRD